jgi:hypothetical protein
LNPSVRSAALKARSAVAYVGRTLLGPASILLFLAVAPASAQTIDRFSFSSTVAVDHFSGGAERPNIIIDLSAAVRLGEGWQFYVRPWLRQPRIDDWDKRIYQAAVRYERSGRVAARVDVGYIASPIGLGMLDASPGINPTIMLHVPYFTPLPVFDPPAPRVQAIASTYPLGAQLTASSDRWDARVAVVNSAPTRIHTIGGPPRRSTPVIVAGAGVTPTVGLRFGIALARGAYATRTEVQGPSPRDRDLTMVAIESEYAFGYTRLTGELVRDAFIGPSGTGVAYAWFVQGHHTLSPRWFAAFRQNGVSAPPLQTGIVVGTRTVLRALEATLGFRVTPEVTVRGSYFTLKPFLSRNLDHQVGASVVWARRWR